MINLIIGFSNHKKHNKINTRNKSWDIRYSICKQCEYAVNSIVFSKITENRYTKIKGKKCSKCNCCLSYKIRSNSKCPINKWK